MREGFDRRLARARVPLGFLLGVVYLLFSKPRPRMLILGAVIAALGLALRALAAGYLEKERTLATTGPYAFTRNPLYLGSAIIATGFAVASGVWWIVVLMATYFVGVYWPVMRHEERRLRERFPEQFAAYSAAVPLFFPRWRPASGPSPGFRSARYWRNREYRALAGYLLAVFLLTLKMRLLR